MPKPPVLPRAVLTLLESREFVAVRQRGSHIQYRHPEGRATTVPFHQERDIPLLLLRPIARDMDLTWEEVTPKI